MRIFNCPFCGERPREYDDQEKYRIACLTFNCPIVGLFISKDQWQKQATARISNDRLQNINDRLQNIKVVATKFTDMSEARDSLLHDKTKRDSLLHELLTKGKWVDHVNYCVCCNINPMHGRHRADCAFKRAADLVKYPYEEVALEVIRKEIETEEQEALEQLAQSEDA